MWVLDALGLLASFTFLGYSSWRDVVSREVPDRVWLASYPVALGLMAVRLIVQSGPRLLILLSVTAAVVLSLALVYLGIWGGADGKGFICLAIMTPLIPTLGGNLSHIVDPFFPLVVFSNAYIASLAAILYAIQRNLRTHPFRALFEGFEGESRSRKAAAFLTGYRVTVEDLESKTFLFPLESVGQERQTPRRRFKFRVRVDSDPREDLKEIKAAVDSGMLHGTIWVSPGLPFLVFVTAGLGLSVLIGDVVWSAVSAVMHIVAAII